MKDNHQNKNKKPGNTLRRIYSSEYCALKNAIHRCHNPRHGAFERYGQRGIRVAPEFQGPMGFYAFLDEVGPRPSADHSLERINNDLGYQPGNLKWATRAEQANNRRDMSDVRDLGWGFGSYKYVDSRGYNRSFRSPLIEWQGETRTLPEWAKVLGIRSDTLRQRFSKNWSLDQIMVDHKYAPCAHGLTICQADRVRAIQDSMDACVDLLDASIYAISARVH